MNNQKILDALTTLTSDFAPLKGEEYYQSIAQYIVENFDIDYVLVGKLNKNKEYIDVVAGWDDNQPIVPFHYTLYNSSFINIIIHDYTLCSKDAQKSFPSDNLFMQMGAEACGGIALHNKAQEVIGVFVLLSCKPFHDLKLMEHLLKLYVGSLSAEMERHESEQNTINLKHIAYYDPLTKLPNRLLITDRIRQAIKNQSRGKNIVAICLMDLDGFKAVNDTLGHAAGDFVLVEAARRIESIIRPEDTIARLGGDEFVIILTDVLTSKDVGNVLLRILHKVSKIYQYKNDAIESISASIGVTLYPEDKVEDDLLLRHADQAMYKAKENGKDQFYFFDTKEHQRIKANFRALKKIEKAIQNAEFELYFQPKLSTHTLGIESVEVLTRWKHPVLQTLSPSEFLPLIENDDIVYQFDEWVIEESLKILEQLHNQEIKLSFSINISSRQFKQKSLIEKVEGIAQKLMIDPILLHDIEFEIIENSALESINHTNETIQALKDMGIGFALDDFGTGYSSLAHLRDLHINTIKIDKSFISNMLRNSQDMAIVHAIVSLSKVFQIEVVAQGAEDIEQVLMLFEMGCDYIQGYRIAKPMNLDNLLTYLENYEPDPRWRASLNYLPRRADFELLLAQSNHKYWVELVIEGLANAEYDALPQLAHESCQLGKWLKHRGKEYFSTLPSFSRLIVVHHRIHREVNALIDRLRQSQELVCDEESNRILMIRDELILVIERLKEEYRTTLMIKGEKYER